MKTLRMRMIMLVAVMAMGVASAMADKYSEGLKKMLDSGAVSQIMTQGLKSVADKSSDARKEYFANQFTQDLADAMAPYYRENMSEKSFDGFMAFYSRPDVVAATTRMTGSVTDTKELMSPLQSAVLTILQGGEPKPVRPVGCSDAFKAKVDKYIEVYKVDKNMQQTLSGVKSTFTQQMGMVPEEQREMVERVLDATMNYLGANMNVIICNMLIKSASEDDLDLLNSVEKEDFYPEMMKATNALTNDIGSLTSSIVGKIGGKD